MASINTSLNYWLASQYSDIGATAVKMQQAQADIASKQARVNALPNGTVLSARTNFRVGQDGKLEALDTTISTVEDALSEQARQQRSQNPFQRALAERQPRFSDILGPQILLSPDDEINLFALEDAQTQFTGTEVLGRRITDVFAEDENGEAVSVEMIPADGTQEKFRLSEQERVAVLYARNGNAVYDSPALEFAV